MPLSLHAATVPTWLQVCEATRTLVDKAEEYCTDGGHPPAEILDASLTENMWTFPLQINSVWMHSAHALAAAESGIFEPDLTDIPDSFDACRAKLDMARKGMEAADPDALEKLAGNDLKFVLGGKERMRFTAQNFLLSFSNPNFFFHAATAYDILRLKGLDIGKRDYLGMPRIKG